MDRFVRLFIATTVLVTTITHPATARTTPMPSAIGTGAVSSIDTQATTIGIKALREGGNAVDAAIATAAALGVTDPFSSGIGGGGFFVYFDAKTDTVHTVDGRETAPATADEKMFLENGTPIPFDEAVSSGLGVGTPGTPKTWEFALEKWGTHSLNHALRPAEKLARQGFSVDETFAQQIANNADRFSLFPSTRELFLPEGQRPTVGTTFRNPDLANTYRHLREHGAEALHHGSIAQDIVSTVRHPPTDEGTAPVRPGRLDIQDLADYEVAERAPATTSYRGLDIYGMAPPSSGTTTVGEALNILENFPMDSAGNTNYFHHYLEASRLAFADRNRWVGDPAFVDVPTHNLLSQDFADSRACLISTDSALQSPVAPGQLDGSCSATQNPAATAYEGKDTTHLTVADRWGNVVSYTLTIEQEGGSGIVVPGRGFLLNNELTDFAFAPTTPGAPEANLPAPGKRPRSSMAPMIVFHDGEVLFAVGSPGGATIITTVLQVFLGRIDRGLPLAEAIAAPRASQRNTATTEAEPTFLSQAERDELRKRGHSFSEVPEIGAATAVERLPDGRWLAAAETTRRGGGSAMVVDPS